MFFTQMAVARPVSVCWEGLGRNYKEVGWWCPHFPDQR